MGQANWDVPRTEEGLQTVLRRIRECREAEDLVEVGHGLLALAYLVKWVRSDTAQPPFVRAHELAQEALEAFRRAGDAKGQIQALVAASAMADPQAREGMLGEAERLAASEEDENCAAMVLAARARAMALVDREGVAVLHRRVLEIYRRTGNERGQAQCLFSLAIGDGASSADKRDFALEAARIYREDGDPSEASRCVSIALMNAEAIEPLGNLEELARQGLQDAQNAGDRGQERHFYGKLALIAAAKGQSEDAEKFHRWATDLQDADGLTPRERWQADIEMTKTMIAMAKAQGHEETVKTFEEELKRLKSSKPKGRWRIF